jgi:hypothetical protein
MADHRVERVRSPIRGCARGAKERRPEERRHHGVARVLGHRLDRCSRKLLRVEHCWVAADQAGRERACLLELARLDCRSERERRPLERTRAEHRPDDERTEDEREPRRERPLCQSGQGRDAADEAGCVERADTAAGPP